MVQINELVQDNSNTIFKIEKISYADLKNNNLLFINLNNWIKWWEFDVFTSILEEFELNKSNFSFFLIYREKAIIGLVTSQLFLRNSNSTATSWLKMNFIMNPSGILHKYNEISSYLIQIIENDLFHLLFENNLSLIREFAYIFIEFPINSKSESFLRNWKNKIKKNSNWSYNIYPLDEIVIVKDNEKKFRDTGHIFYYNPQFLPDIPYLIKMKYDKALIVYQSLKELKNPFIGDLNEKFDKIIETKKFYNEISPQVIQKLQNYKNKRDELWHQYSIRQNENQFDLYIKTMEADIELLCSYGFRFVIFNPKCETGLNLMNSIQNALIMNNIESFQSQGSVFQTLYTDVGAINPEFFKKESLLKLTNEFGGFIEYELSPDNWIFIGYACGSYKKKKQCYSNQLNCTLIFLENFRGFSLAGLLAFIGMLAVIEKFDIMYEDATISNKNTHKLVNRIGFNSYGLTKNRYYAPNPINNNELNCVAMIRNILINPTLIIEKCSNSLLYSIRKLDNLNLYIKLKNILLLKNYLKIIGI